MAKEETKKPSWGDFTVEDPFKDNEEDDFVIEDEVEEEDTEEDESEEEEEVEEKPKPKAKVKSTKKEKEVIEEEEPEEEKKVVPPGKVKTTKAERVKEEEEQTSNEEEEEPEDNQESDIAKEFFEEVSRITGNDLEVEYGDTDPLSPQGVALRENAIKASAIDSVLEEIETKYPKVFKALQVAGAGGDVAELFKITAGKDYSKITLSDEDDIAAKQVLTDWYKAKGIKNDAKIANLIAQDEDSTLGLVGEAKAALKELQDEQTQKENELLANQKAKEAEGQKRDNVLLTAIDDVIAGGKLGNWKFASKQDATDFRKFLDNKIRRADGGKYEFGIAIEPTNMEKALQYMFFVKNGGDLSKFIQVKASTENAKKLRLGIQKENATNKQKATGEDNGKKKLSLRDLNVV